ncbi:hypothetical protein B0I33_101424 [Prauserella shujinwangii]|uniref:Uncharacterized protein n=1 Tax=Prauserella shujinwangii TaxID=1453103 RepID=A0A2T0M3D8_9PSEU|nr:hypothetical protein [Prauserella shujinwangii]PRX51271.1 hypothetical protein B0I33_101424 [Prauserella shujinwangii]
MAASGTVPHTVDPHRPTPLARRCRRAARCELRTGCAGHDGTGGYRAETERARVTAPVPAGERLRGMFAHPGERARSRRLHVGHRRLHRDP